MLSAVLFWADYLRPKADFFTKKNLPLVFGSLPFFETDVGINDVQWCKSDPNFPPDEISETQDSLLPISDRRGES